MSKIVERQQISEEEKIAIGALTRNCRNTSELQEMLKSLFAGAVETMLEAEMEEHLGYEKNSIKGNNSGNSRNGYGHKTITSDYGESEIVVPRDRNGTFEPQVIAKRQTRTDEIESKVVSMYAKGMTTRDIEDTLREIYGAEVSASLISRITDKLLHEINEWQYRPLDAVPCGVFRRGSIQYKIRKQNHQKMCVFSTGHRYRRAQGYSGVLDVGERKRELLGKRMRRPEKAWYTGHPDCLP